MSEACHKLSVVAGGGDPGWGTTIAKDARGAEHGRPGCAATGRLAWWLYEKREACGKSSRRDARSPHSRDGRAPFAIVGQQPTKHL